MLKKIGWIADTPEYLGGAELASLELQRCKPEWAEIVPLNQGDVVEPGEVDAIVVHNCVFAASRYSIPTLQQVPVIKYVHDSWLYGDAILKSWLLENAALVIFSSPLHKTMFPDVKAPIALLPNPLDLEPFVTASGHCQPRKPACWVGRFHPFKGMAAAAQWAKECGITLDFYGYGDVDAIRPLGNYGGNLNHADVPQVMACYEQFVFMPQEPEPFSRVTVEAWAAGCEIVVNDKIGALWWLEHNPDALFKGAEMFWQSVEAVL